MVSTWGQWCLSLLLAAAWPAFAEQVVVSKIMYHPRGDKPEYIELYNNTSNPFDIARWRLAGSVRFEFPGFASNAAAASFLRPFERIVLSGASPAATRQAYSIAEPVRIFGPWSGRLPDDEGRITIKDKNEITVCALSYGGGGRWPAAADGAGHALALIDPDARVDDWRNWTATTRPGGSPGSAPVPGMIVPAPSPEIEANLGQVLVDYDALWRYDDSGRGHGDAWYAVGFDDASWSQGPGLLGYDKKPLPKPGLQTRVKFGRQITYYFRLGFNFAGAVKPGDRLVIDQVLDDGAVYYLNGQEIARSRIPAGPVNHLTLATVTVPDATEEMSEIILDPSLLKPGSNVLAAEVHQVKATSTDIVFGMRLRLTPPQKPGPVINEVCVGGGGDFIELHNTASTAANLRGCFLSDTPDNLRKFSFSRETILPPGGLLAVGLEECGLRGDSPFSVYLTSADGRTVLSAVTANFSRDGRSLGRRPDGGNAWFRFPQPTRAAPNPDRNVAVPLRLNEAHCAGQFIDWVELRNLLDTPFPLTNLWLASSPALSDKTPLVGRNASISARGFASFDVRFPVQNGEVRLYLLNETETVLDGMSCRAPSSGGAVQAVPDGGQEWFVTTNSTRNAANGAPPPADIVINEIMYDPPLGAEGTEFIELHNRGAQAVDVSGWRLAEGVSFVFPEGCLMAPGAYLVAAANAEVLKNVYGDIPIAGEYRGRLRHSGERIRLLDSRGNLVNELDFRAEGDWPALAHGGGSSLELIHPWMDNSRSSAWRDSEEASKTSWQTFAVTNFYLELNPQGSPQDYRELHLYLATHGHVALRKIGLWNNGVNFLDRPDRMSDDGTGAAGWLAQGTHAASFMTNGELHLVSDGHGDYKVDRAELDCVRVRRGQRYELRFEARWISGCPRLIAATWDHSFGGSWLLPLPARLGTPGRPNSVSGQSSARAAQAAPQADDLAHHPAVPRSTETVKVTARIFCASPLASVRLFHRLDSTEGDASWQDKPMFDDGVNGGDEVAGDGIYTGELTEYRANRAVAQFYVQAVAANGRAVVLPRSGAAAPALFVVDDRKIRRDLRTDRFVVSAFDLDSMARGNTAKHGFHYPRLSNHRYNMTFISNEEKVYYGGGIRVSGSPFTRGTDLGKGKWDLPSDRPFRGRTKFYFDNDANYHNRLCRYLLYQMGHVSGQAEWIRVIVNSSGASLKEDTEPVTGEFLERNFKNGNRGELYRIDDEWWFADDWDYNNQDADWRYRGTDDPARYRPAWLKRSREVEDDYGSLIAFIKTYSANRYSQEEIERWLDADAILRFAAVRGFINDWDNFTMFRGKNGYLYRRPGDGRFQFLQWDSDLAFRDGNYPLYGDRVAPWLQRPYNAKRFEADINQVIELVQSPRLAAWFEAEQQANPARPPNVAFYNAFFQRRIPFALNMLKAGSAQGLFRNLPFALPGRQPAE